MTLGTDPNVTFLGGEDEYVHDLYRKEFKAKPHGDRAQKQWYIDNFEEQCLNHYATVKYFYMSDDDVPLQPSVSSVRLEEDM